MLFGCKMMGSPDWTVYVYLQSDGPLDYAAHSSMQVLKKALKKPNAHGVRVYLDRQKKDRIESYLIDYTGMTLLSEASAYNMLAALKQSCTRAFHGFSAGYPAGRTMLLFSGHGSGILEPQWNQASQRWVYEPDEGDSPYTRHCRQQNSVLYDAVDRAWNGSGKALFLSRESGMLPHQQMVDLIRFVSHDLLKGKKIDLIGFDACHMAMLEIAYDLKEYAQYMIASQECVENDGWDYQAVVNALYADQPLYQVARSLVYAFEALQHKKGEDRYSLSAFDLQYVDRVVAALDAIVVHIERSLPLSTAYRSMPLRIEEMIRALDPLYRARQKNQRDYWMSMYADLRLFCETLLQELSLVHAQSHEQLKEALIKGIEMLNEMVIASVAGSLCPYVQGCSIYFPTAHIDSSYTNAFAHDRRWASFLRSFCGLGNGSYGEPIFAETILSHRKA